MFSTIKNVHFVGIGGIGMSGIAEILINQGFVVSGSDSARSDNTDYLENLGAKIFIGHDESNIIGAEVTVYSSAVNPLENPETVASHRNNIPVIRRAEMLAEVSRLNYCLAISGTHGKTTTTSICGLILLKAGIDPTVIVGGRLKDFGGSNARLGKGNWTVVEADEYDRSFLQLYPTIAIVNNIEREHLDIYKDFTDLKQTFTTFANRTPFYGLVAVGLDDPGAAEIYPDINKKTVSFGLFPQCDYFGGDIEFKNNGTEFSVFEFGKYLGTVHLKIPGLHNVKNALGAIAVSRSMGIDFDIIKSAISEFNGVYRRFEIRGEYKGAMIVDDYAHHPTEIAATLAAARKTSKGRVIAVFQPHTFTRTRDFYLDFARSFFDADIVYITDIYPSREKPIEGISSQLIIDAAKLYGHKHFIYKATQDEITLELEAVLQENDLMITLGAGNIYKIAEKLTK
ncbi:MAG: UDP-N-acetylmuramate--L-alanine ligase [Candidatus Kapabacteria bacterium]|nr:UDP-N-acetylmuramate--L-alanine ligase [Candidatus Kapabacteria bacterium]